MKFHKKKHQIHNEFTIDNKYKYVANTIKDNKKQVVDIRKKINDMDGNYIETVRGIGYKMK